MEHNKKVNLTLVGLDGNAFAILGAFSRQARKEKWTQSEIDYVKDKAMSGGYENLVSTIAAHCESPAGGGEDAESEELEEDCDDES